MDFIRTDNVLGNKKIVVGDKYSDLVLETLGKVYVKTGNQAQVLDQLIKTLIQNADNPKTIFVNSELEMNEMKYPGDGTFVFNKLNNSLYIALDSRYVLIVQVNPDGSPQYVNKRGDTMTGQLEISTVNAPLIVHSSQLVKNLNVEYLNRYSSDDFAKKKVDEVIYGNWQFDGVGQSNNNWIFKENTRFYKDIITSGSLSSPEFASGFGGYGWRLDSNTNTLTVDYLVVRKAMQVYELVINQISATNGSLWVSNAVKVDTAYRPYIITKEELDTINTGTKDEINAKLNSIFWDNSYFLITDLGLTINQDTNNLGVSTEQNIGNVTESKSLSSANYINNTSKEFVNLKYIIWIGDLNNVIDDASFPGVSAFYDENYLFNTNTNENLKAYYLSKEIYVSEWNEDNTPKVSNYLSTFNKATELFIKPRNSSEIVGLKPYYKYFALSKESMLAAINQHVSGVKKVPVPTIYIIESDPDMNPTLKSGDIIRCQKFEDNNIKYYDAIVTSHFKSKGYFLQKAVSVFDIYTEISYDDDGEVNSYTETDNSILYDQTDKTYNPNTGTYDDNYSTTEKVADVSSGDDIVQMGNIYNTQRQNAIYITSTDDQGPYIDIMSGLNRPDYSVIYDQPVYKKIKVFVKQKGGIFVQGEPYDYYYQKENPQAVNFNQKPTYISGNTKKYPLVYITVDEKLNTTGTYINDGETNNIPENTLQGYFITNYPTQYSIKEENSVTGTKITKVRLGNLDGIYNPVFKTKQPYGFGLYGENVFLTGEFYLNNGQSVVDFSKDYIDLQIKSVNDNLLSTGINIQDKTITVTADKFKIQANDGTQIGAFVNDGNNVYFNADLIKVKTIKNEQNGIVYYELKADGSGQLGRNNFRWDTEGNVTLTGTIYANEGRFSGELLAPKGNIGGFTINSSYLSAGSPTFGNYISLEATHIYFSSIEDNRTSIATFGASGSGVLPGVSGLSMPVGIYRNVVSSPNGENENVGLYISCTGGNKHNAVSYSGNIAINIESGFIRGLRLNVKTTGDILPSEIDSENFYNMKNSDTFVYVSPGINGVNLPSNPQEGQMYIIRKGNYNGVIYARAKGNTTICVNEGASANNFSSQVQWDGRVAGFFVYSGVLKIDNKQGVWIFNYFG